MASPAGSLVVKVGADVSGLNRGARQTESTLTKLGGHARLIAGGLAALGAAAVAAGAAMVTGLVKSGLEAIDAQAKLAQTVGGTIDSVRALQIAAEGAGISTQEMTGNLQRMNRRLGEIVSSGAGPAAEWIKRLGLNAQELIDMPLDERVAAIADEISELGSTAEMASAAFAIFGDAGLRMVPMLQQGGDAIRAAAKEVDEFGLSLSEVDAAQVEAANDAMSRIGRVMESFRNQITVALAGPLKAFAEWFANATKEGSRFREVLSTAFTVIGRAAGFFIDILAGQVATWFQLRDTAFSVVESIANGLSWLGDRFREMINAMIRGINAVADFLPGIQGGIEEIQPGWIGRRFEDAMQFAENAVAMTMDRIRERLGGELPSESITRMFEEIQESSRRAAEEVVKARGAIMGFGVPGEGAGGGAAEAEEEEWRKRFERILSRFDTEQQALRDHQVLMSDLNRAWREGEFETEEEFRQIREQAEAEHMERLRRIRERGNRNLEDETADSWKDQLKTVSTIGDSMVSAAGSAGGKMFKVAKIAGAAQAFVATLTGQAEALKLGWPLGPIAAAKIGAQGFGLVAAIKTADFGGGGRGGAAAATADTTLPSGPQTGADTGRQELVQDVSVTLVGGNLFSAEQLEQLGEVLADNGGRIGAFKVLRAA